jgi:hypothetical protein
LSFGGEAEGFPFGVGEAVDAVAGDLIEDAVHLGSGGGIDAAARLELRSGCGAGFGLAAGAGILARFS